MPYAWIATLAPNTQSHTLLRSTKCEPLFQADDRLSLALLPLTGENKVSINEQLCIQAELKFIKNLKPIELTNILVARFLLLLYGFPYVIYYTQQSHLSHI